MATIVMLITRLFFFTSSAKTKPLLGLEVPLLTDVDQATGTLCQIILSLYSTNWLHRNVQTMLLFCFTSRGKHQRVLWLVPSQKRASGQCPKGNESSSYVLEWSRRRANPPLPFIRIGSSRALYKPRFLPPTVSQLASYSGNIWFQCGHRTIISLVGLTKLFPLSIIFEKQSCMHFIFD